MFTILGQIYNLDQGRESTDPKSSEDNQNTSIEMNSLKSSLRSGNSYSGGNINKIYKMCGLADWQMLHRNDLREKIEFLKQFSPKELIEQFDIRDDRADVIVHGANIYLRAMIEAGINEIIVPKVGLADGLIRRAYYSNKEKNKQ